MTPKITKSDQSKMRNPILQFFKYISLSFRIMKIVGGGHGGTRK